MSTIFDSRIVRGFNFELILRIAIREEEEIFNGSYMKPTMQTTIMNNSGLLFMGLNITPIIIFKVYDRDGVEELKIRDVDFYGIKSKLDKFILTYKALKKTYKKNKKYLDDYIKSVQDIIKDKKKSLAALNKAKDPILKEEEEKYVNYVNKENENIAKLNSQLKSIRQRVRKLGTEYRVFYDPNDRNRFNNIKFETATVVDYTDKNRERMMEGFNIILNGLNVGVSEQFLFMLSDKLNNLNVDLLAQNMYNTYLYMQNSNQLKEIKKDRRYQEKQHVMKEEVNKQKKMIISTIHKKNEIRPGISHMSSSKPSTNVDDAFNSLNSFNNKE